MDVGDNTRVCNSDIREEFIELLVVADGEHDMARDNADLLIVAGSITREFEDLRGQVLENTREVDGSSDTDTPRILTLSELAVETTNGEGETSARRARGLASLFGNRLL